VVEQVAQELAGKVKIVGVNVDEGGEAAASTGIMSIPALVFFKGGKEVHRVVGALKKPALLELIKTHLG
jgi:thioredoxin-like negative regulator of GroEL